MVFSEKVSSVFSPTHVLSYEKRRGGKVLRVEEHVKVVGNELLTQEEWLDHSGADWSLDGSVLYFRGRKQPRARLIKLPEPPLPLQRIRELYFRGVKSAADLAAVSGQSPERVQAALRKLRWLRMI